MNVKQFPTFPFLPKLIRLALVTMVALTVGVFLIVVTGRVEWGVGVILIAGILEVSLVFKILRVVECPTCDRELTRASLNGGFDCALCQTTWIIENRGR